MLPAAGLPAVGKFLTTHAYCDLSFLPQVVYLSFVLFTAYVSLLTLEYVDTFLFVASLVVLRRLLGCEAAQVEARTTGRACLKPLPTPALLGGRVPQAGAGVHLVARVLWVLRPVFGFFGLLGPE
jgi:hypothetical protein